MELLSYISHTIITPILMNLPQLHERVFISQKAESVLSKRLYDKVFNNYAPKLDESINVFSQCIINLTKEESEKVFINEPHRKIENILDEVSNEYNLTYGEKVNILVGKIQGDVKYVIRWERHKDLSKEGSIK